eukprot:TRINITY_DN5977_c0_g1_i1.p1 TRINITY_DN5977_c0_g1~~TRINITY_DN5977_c0_g1_i1.p1  ORF type:complete len:640 (+),score=108.88 TRINITY_DN5977_c0_g1_i1:277-2196(+)
MSKRKHDDDVSKAHDDVNAMATAPHWAKIGGQDQDIHGINVPLFSLHSKDTCGIGEFGSLYPLIPWCGSVSLRVIQLLPLNECNAGNPSPFSALSAYALDPNYLSLRSLPNLHKYPDLIMMLDQMSDSAPAADALRQEHAEAAVAADGAPDRTLETEHLKLVDYEDVRALKKGFLDAYLAKERLDIYSSAPFTEFSSQNREWLHPYIAFKILKGKNNQQSWEQWPADEKDMTATEMTTFIGNCMTNSVLFEQWQDIEIVQYLCWVQMSEAKSLASRNNVMIKGDIPYLVSRDSADVWSPITRKYFDLQYSAGAPPDQYSADGQDWDMPVYNWDALAEDDYGWWRNRLRVAEQYYHLYRIDHIVGFFRIWSITHGKKATEGSFQPLDEDKWIPHGETHLRLMLESCGMLPIGEDLGTVPDEVRSCLSRLGICGTRVLFWERKWGEAGDPFIPTSQYTRLSMTTMSTHDSEPFRLWYGANPDQAEPFAHFMGWKYLQTMTPEEYKEVLMLAHRSNSIFHINLLNEYFPCIPNLAYQRAEDDRVNVPGKVLARNWAYRFRPSVEEIISNPALAALFKELTAPRTVVPGGASSSSSSSSTSTPSSSSSSTPKKDRAMDEPEDAPSAKTIKTSSSSPKSAASAQ